MLDCSAKPGSEIFIVDSCSAAPAALGAHRPASDSTYVLCRAGGELGADFTRRVLRRARQIRERTGSPTRILPSLGSTVAFDALVAGDLDAYVDYSGTIWATIMQREALPGRRAAVLAEVERYLAQSHGVVVASATFRLRRGDPAAALARIDELNRKRWASLPSGLPNAGSIFRNPPGDHAGRLIEVAGLKGRRKGGAEISTKHANVIVNVGGASADDVLFLMMLARSTVRDRLGVDLEPEIVLEGELRDRWCAEESPG